MLRLSFVAPAFEVALSRREPHDALPATRWRRRLGRARLACRCAGWSREDPPDYDSLACTPDKEPRLVASKVYAFGAGRVILRPEDDATSHLTLMMSVSDDQLQAISAAMCSDPADRGVSELTDVGPPSMYSKSDPDQELEIPTIHNLMFSIVAGHGAGLGFVCVTHVEDSAFIGRVFLNGPSEGAPPINLDSRPSDAIVMATLFGSPIYVGKSLFYEYGMPLPELQGDINGGTVVLAPQSPTILRQQMELRPNEITVIHPKNPKYQRMSILKARIELAIGLQRFQEARELSQELKELCPVDFLQSELDEAVAEERFLDAAQLREEIKMWKRKVMEWERDM